MTPEQRSEQKKRANKLEYWLAEYLGGRRVPASGALDSWKGDVELDEILIDSKHTVKSSITLKAMDLCKIHREAREADRDGHIILTFYNEDTHWAVVPKRDCDFESREKLSLAGKSKLITIHELTSLEKQCFKKSTNPSIRIHFDSIKLGVPREWLIIPIKFYKENVLNEF